MVVPGGYRENLMGSLINDLTRALVIRAVGTLVLYPGTGVVVRALIGHVRLPRGLCLAGAAA